MIKEAEQLLAAALKSVKLNDGFCPTEIGAKAGMDKHQAEAGARALANAGVLVLGFDLAAHFTRDYRNAHTPAVKKPAKKKRAAVVA